ncbi:MAG: type II toxin-antitoxin system HicB family antitoxin, partial [Hyphomonadaceae bacterium]
GAITQGDTFEEAIRNARDALETILQDQLEQGVRLQGDDSISYELTAGLARAERAIPVAIVTDFSFKTTRVNISIDEQLLARIDREAASTGRTRSGFLADAARKAMKQN